MDNRSTRPIARVASLLVLLLLGCAGAKPELLGSSMTVHIEACDTRDASGTVTNGSTQTADIFIELGDGKAVVWGLAAGATTSWQASFVGACQASVSAYPAGEVQTMQGGG